jgi:hypothetical protein
MRLQKNSEGHGAAKNASFEANFVIGRTGHERFFAGFAVVGTKSV